MSLDLMRIWIESTVMTTMAKAYPAVPVRFENASLLQPETAWTALTLLEGRSFGVALGSRKVDRHIGLVQFDVMVPERAGTALANRIAQTIGDVLKTKKIGLTDGSSVLFRAPLYVTGGQTSGFFRMICRVPYWRDESAQLAVITPVEFLVGADGAILTGADGKTLTP